MEEKDAPSFTVMFGMNISEEQALNRKFQRQEKKLGAAERLRQEFTSNVTHELRTPINGIKGHAQILADTELTGEQRQRLNTILRACTDMENLVNSILDYSKLEAGKFDLENKPFSFREFIHHVEAVNRIGIENKGLDFLVSFDETIPEELMGDELRLTQILNNLISNARKFTASGQITLKVSMTEIREKEVELFFMVVDTGIGIARSDLDKLFQPFSQVDASIARQYGGTGLGLAICKQLVENMGGRIQVSSIKGEGSNFSFNVLLGCLGKSEIIERQEQEMYLEAPAGEADEKKEKRKLHFEDGDEPLETEEEMIFGSEVNRREVRAHLIRIIICLEMERFDKAEEYLDAVKLFLKHAPQDVSKLLFRMGMQVRKENYDKSYAYYLQLSELLNQIWEEEA
jgi:nitrogen-specific signal transduction histidine kinase